ncbi:MAG: MoaD/ThiS family protein [Pyrinomonadaceae bacterium]|nr:MoaD/ThiS family protein [Pyrinomonadaceae bacterium]MCX7640632.1 MoaD/ThiS family protein [Pyrinomonadaceae bacterium]MDW8305333.1 MoaD/ThiS family protein [Acidobacteriota bacterium]
MQIKVLFFGATADIVGSRELVLSLPENSKAIDAFQKVIKEFPSLEKHKLLFAVNEEYSKGEELLKEGDELAIFTAVSGG